MITHEQRRSLIKWFKQYTQSFIIGKEDYDEDITLKIHHSYRVASHVIQIGTSLDLSAQQQNLAFFCGLLHDIGRFEQYKKYQTYDDKTSVNHAEFGVKIMEEIGILNKLDATDKDLITGAVNLHNRKDLPLDISEELNLYTMMVRDADKLDILDIFSDKVREDKYNFQVALRLPDEGQITDSVFDQVMINESVSYTNLKTYNDLKIVSMAWLNDLNFLYSFDVIKSQMYLDILRDGIKGDDRAFQVYEKYRELLEETCAENT